jgi:hypothetical protein
MSHADCENLDDFLADGLQAAAASDFIAHLDRCERCREAVDEQQWIDGLLRSPLAVKLEAPPNWIWERVTTRLARRRQNVKFLACGLAAAAAVVIAVGWTVKLNRQARVPVQANLAELMREHNRRQSSSETIVDKSAPLPPPRATFVGGPDVLVVPIESRHPNVTVVRIYPTYEPEFAAQANAELPTTPDEFIWPFELNGG